MKKLVLIISLILLLTSAGYSGFCGGFGNCKSAFSIYMEGEAHTWTGTNTFGTTLFITKTTAAAELFDALILTNAFSSNTATGVGIYFSPNPAAGYIRSASIRSYQDVSGNFADLRFYTAVGNPGVERIKITSSGHVFFNDPGLDVDFRIETNNDANTFFVDGGTDRVGIGTIAPYHLISSYTSNPIWAQTDTDVNLNISSAAEAIDTSAVYTSIVNNNGRVSIASDVGETAYFSIIDGGGDADTVVVEGDAALAFRFGNNSLIVSPNGDVSVSNDLTIDGDLSVGGIESKFGDMYLNANGTATTMETASSPIGVRHFTTGDQNGFTFDAGGTGAITAYADYGDGGGDTVTVTDNSHGLADGDFIVIRGTTNYNGVWQIGYIGANSFYIVDTWVADDGASDWEEPSYLQLTAGTNEVFSVQWFLSAQKGGGASATVLWCVYKNTTPFSKTISQREFPGTDIGSVSGGGIITSVSAGDRFFLVIQSDNTNDITNKYGTLILVQE